MRLSVAIAGLLLLMAGPAAAQGLGKVQVRGVEGEALDNVRQVLSLEQVPEADRAGLSEARLSYLLRQAPAEIDRALRPYGFYGSTVDLDVVRRDGGPVDVNVVITPGEPTRVRALELEMDGAAADDRTIQRQLKKFRPQQGDVMDHRQYSASVQEVQRALMDRGYFDAEMLRHRFEVSRALREATVDVAWSSGVRYRFGETRFEGSHIRESLLRKTIPYEVDKPYSQTALLRLNRRLTDLDYFGYIDVRPDIENAVDGRMPILISLLPGKRSVYTAGLSFGTDAGAGVQLGMERRWINDRGHKLGTHLDWAQRRRSLGVEYRIPAFAWAEGWYTLGANRREEESDVQFTRITEIAASRTGLYRGWNLGVSMHARMEDFEIGDEHARRNGTAITGKSRLIYPALSAHRVIADDPVYPTRGFSLRGEFKVGASALGSDTNFAQFLLDGKLIRSLGDKNRFLFRGQLGRTFTDEFDELPPSLRFFAGGDRSIRGYDYQEVGPRADGLPIGGKNLLTGSAEYERMFTPTWGAAVFVDAGNTFNEVNEGASVGVGAGLRWRSPVGMVRVDLAHGFDSDSAFQLHINIGPDL